MFFLGIGMTPVPWILLGEWFVSETRSMAGGIASAMFFLSALISLQVSTLVCSQLWSLKGLIFLLFLELFSTANWSCINDVISPYEFMWKNSYIERPNNTALNFLSPKLRVRFFVLLFVMETSQFLTAKHWLSWLPVTLRSLWNSLA